MTFDENKSWYYEENKERIERKNRRAIMDPKFQENLKFDGKKIIFCLHYIFVLHFLNVSLD